MHRRLGLVAVGCVVGLAACSGAPRSSEQSSGATAGPGDSDDDSGAATAASGAADATAGGESGGAPVFDVASIPDGGLGGEGCSKVDILFSIDNSGSMETSQTNLVASFPGFIAQMQSQLADVASYHVGVVTTDTPCLITQTSGPASSNAMCGPYQSGGSYMSEADDLGSTFACAAQVGIGGNANERHMAQIEAALGPTLSGPGGCNEGFRRADALFVLVLITDTDDNMGSPGAPSSWFSTVTGAAGDIEENVVVLAITGQDPPNACPQGIDQKSPPRLRAFASMFTHDFPADVCEADYGPFLADAINVIDTACLDFTPAG